MEEFEKALNLWPVISDKSFLIMHVIGKILSFTYIFEWVIYLPIKAYKVMFKLIENL